MPNRFCESQIPGEYDVNRLDCRELSIPDERIQCPYLEEHIQLRHVNSHPQLHITRTESGIVYHCHDFLPTPETNSRLIAKLSQQ